MEMVSVCPSPQIHKSKQFLDILIAIIYSWCDKTS
jgi:hypothetical protein